MSRALSFHSRALSSTVVGPGACQERSPLSPLAPQSASIFPLVSNSSSLFHTDGERSRKALRTPALGSVTWYQSLSPAGKTVPPLMAPRGRGLKVRTEPGDWSASSIPSSAASSSRMRNGDRLAALLFHSLTSTVYEPGSSLYTPSAVSPEQPRSATSDPSER
ncbi:MAG: hypothetical protein BWY99_01694 [Synergistetes bacterium ADurb.BinA166]|nr:MAG: hypothetical protein BWY99_01694 [Synergistetes bacterium ADurb.BinA166]